MLSEIAYKVINIKIMWFLQKLSNNHEVLHAKTAIQDLFKSFFQNLIKVTRSWDMLFLYWAKDLIHPVDGKICISLMIRTGEGKGHTLSWLPGG